MNFTSQPGSFYTDFYRNGAKATENIYAHWLYELNFHICGLP